MNRMSCVAAAEWMGDARKRSRGLRALVFLPPDERCSLGGVECASSPCRHRIRSSLLSWREHIADKQA